MEKIVINNETYYINNGRVYDSSFLEAPKDITRAIWESWFAGVDFSSMEESQLLEHIKKLKGAEYYTECLRVIEHGLQRFNKSAHYYRTVFPMITSCYRSLNQPQKAIDFWMENKQLFSSCLSPALLTSLAAAYCDVGNYEMARKCANKAYAIQGGSLNYSNELSLVYKRIKKESDDGTLL